MRTEYTWLKCVIISSIDDFRHPVEVGENEAAAAEAMEVPPAVGAVTAVDADEVDADEVEAEDVAGLPDLKAASSCWRVSIEACRC